jgi:hypothetical protein
MPTVATGIRWCSALVLLWRKPQQGYSLLGLRRSVGGMEVYGVSTDIIDPTMLNWLHGVFNPCIRVGELTCWTRSGRCTFDFSKVEYWLDLTAMNDGIFNLVRLMIISICTKPLRGSFSPRFYNGFEPNCFFEFICSFFDRGGKFPLYRYKWQCDANIWNYNEKRKWILYPYSSLHARLEYGFVHICFINHPARQIDPLIFYYLSHLAAKPKLNGDCRGTIDRTLVTYL